MTIFVNGQEMQFESAKLHLFDVISSLGINDKVMAAAVNSVIVKKDSWHTHELCANDKLELLQFTGGG